MGNDAGPPGRQGFKHDYDNTRSLHGLFGNLLISSSQMSRNRPLSKRQGVINGLASVKAWT